MESPKASRPGVTIFAAGDVVSGRYRIERFIARGGAAEIYEADDQELGQRVALKAIRREYSSNKVAIERFKREVNLARQVTHPNVCRIYEFGQEQHGHEDVVFLTMELLEGENLHERIQRQGPFTAEQALPLVRQMAAGLDAAAKVSVVHRDFKSSNVMLVPSESAEGGLRVVIADFGMARMASTDQGGQMLTGQDLIVGSPAYMAPEQIESGPISIATDIYSVGVVLYEMVTGEFPFQGETALATALMRLKENPPSPRLLARDLDPRWERAILRCLERSPAKRFASASELVAALDEEAKPVTSSDGKRWRWLVAAALLCALLIAGTVANRFFERGRKVTTEVLADFTARRSIALLGFRNLSGQSDAAWLSTALAEMLAMEIAAGDELRVIPGENVARSKIELGFSDNEGLGAEDLSRIGELLGSELVVLGSYLLAGGEGERELRLDLQARSVESGETVARISERGTESDVLNLIELAGRGLRRELGVGAVTAADVAALQISRPASAQTARLYSEGLEALRRYDARAALELLQAAVEREPDHPLIHSALSSAWGVLGYTARAREEAEIAFRLAEGLSRRDRLWVEARYRDAAGQSRSAVEIYRRLWDYFPDNLEYGLRLARAQTTVGQGEEALVTVERLRALPSASQADPRIDLSEARAARSLAQYSLQQERAARAADKAAALGASLLMARAREVEAGAWRDLGEPDKAMAAYEEAKATYSGAGHRAAVARVLIAISKIQRHQGRFDEARALNEEALVVAREIGDQGSVKQALVTLALILRQQGRLSEALEMHELELETNREIGDLRSTQYSLTALGVVQESLGDLGGAAGRFEEALELSRKSGNMRSVAINLNMLGAVRSQQGRLDDARSLFEEALSTNRETGSPRGRAYYLSSLADVDFASADLENARQKYEEALSIRREIREKTNVAFSLLSLGVLALEEGRPQEAIEHANEAATQFENGDQPDAYGRALSLLAKAYLANGRSSEAQAAADRATSLVETSENRGTRLVVEMRAASVAASVGRLEEGVNGLQQVIDEAERHGFVGLVLEARLELGQIELSREDRDQGNRRLATLAREARQQGYELIARKADAASS